LPDRTANQHPAWLLYGANGYTGRLIAEESVGRGMTPILAGRTAAAVEPIAERLGCPARIFALDQPGEIARHLEGVHTVLHCAGPFSRTAGPMLEACLRAGANYLDITGEIDVIEVAAGLHERAAAAGVSLIPAVGFDVVPTDCLAAMLAARLPDATRLELAISGPFRMSPGTTRTVLEGLAGGGRARVEGRIERVPVAWKVREIPFREGPRRAVTIPWGDVASAFHTTGIPNIEVYSALPRGQIRALRCLRWGLPALGLPPVRWLLGRAIRRWLAGPSAEHRRTAHASLWGRVENGEGRAVEATLRTPEGYRLTADAAIECTRRVLGGSIAPGFATPARAFGPELILALDETDVQWRA
jgi:short subunit dehydrogenase-like uncharacterized protein